MPSSADTLPQDPAARVQALEQVVAHQAALLEREDVPGGRAGVMAPATRAPGRQRAEPP